MNLSPPGKECPKCGYTFPEPLAECPRCGVVIAKYRTPPAPDPAPVARSGGWLGHLFHAPGQVAPLFFWLRLGIWVGLVVWGGRLVSASVESNFAGESVLHMVNLPFHEAGHLLFGPFGSLVQSLGGTLGQLLVPILCGLALLIRNRDPFGASICLWWFGENFLDIAPYINDARAGQLPLLGGNTGWAAPYGFHDWIFILNETGLAAYDHEIATFSHHFGGLLILGALVWGAMLLSIQYRRLGWEGG